MKFTFIEKKMAPSDSLRAYAEKKVSKIDRLFRTESEANVTFSTERGRFTAEITIKNNGTFFRAHETTSDMYASVDSAVATIERQIRKNKTRLAKKLRAGAFEREVQPEYVPADDAVEAGTFEVVRRKRFPIKPMSVEEAILQMDLLEHTFFVFRDVASDGAVSVSTGAKTAATASSPTRRSKRLPPVFGAAKRSQHPKIHARPAPKGAGRVSLCLPETALGRHDRAAGGARGG